MSNEIPQSSALAEASLDSLAELMSRDPEGYSRQDRVRIIEALRAMRAKWEAAELASQSGAKRPRGAKATGELVSVSTSNAEDLGL